MTIASSTGTPVARPGGLGVLSPARVERRVVWLIAAALLALHATLAWLARAPGIVTYEDDAQYVLLARSVRQLGYREIWRVDSPVHAMYPPGYPTLLAAWRALGSEQFDWFVVLAIVTSVGALALTFAIAGRMWSYRLALAILAALAVNPSLVERAGNIVAEPPFMFLTMAALWAMARDRPSRGWLVVGGAAAIAAALVRSIGVALIAAILLHLLLQRRYRATAVMALAAALTKGLWIGWILLAPTLGARRSYVADTAQMAEAIGALPLWMALYQHGVGKAFRYFGVIIPFDMPFPTVAGTPVDNAFWAFLTTAALAVGVRVLWRRWRAAVLYLATTFAILAVWRYIDGRFTAPLVPILVIAVLTGASALVARIRPALAPACLALLLTILIGTGTVRSLRLIEARAGCERGAPMPPGNCLLPPYAAYLEAERYVARNLPRDAVVLSGRPAAVHYYTGRKAVTSEMVRPSDPQRLPEFLRQYGATHVLLGRVHASERRVLAPRLAARCADFAIEAAFEPSTYVLRLREPGEPEVTGGASACEALESYLAKLPPDWTP